MKTDNVRFTSTWILTLATVAAAIACDTAAEQVDNIPGQSGISMQALVSDDTDVEGIQFDVTPVNCDDGTVGGPTTSTIEPIDPDQTIPGNLEDLQNSPLDEDSSHLFADSFQVLSAGCYDVVATPVDDDGDASNDCARAFKNGVKVNEGETTEIFLINQCEGEDPGALDVIAALNHEPVLEDVNFSDSKFSCGSPTEICAVASDPDNDPVELVLLSEDCDVSPVGESAPGSQCWELTCSTLGTHDLSVVVYDLLHGTSSDPQRIEDWLTEEGYPNQSHAELSFHAYVDGVQLWPDVDGDGHGDASADASVFCNDDDTDGFVDNHDDCNDGDANAYPGNSETCGDDVDNDCDGSVDEDCFTCDNLWVCDFTHAIQVCHNCDSGGASYCFKNADGGGTCTDDFYCAGKPKCMSNADCAAGTECIVDSCCDGIGTGVGTCAPLKLMCSISSASASEEGSKASQR